MNTFEVWMRPLGECCRVRVKGIDNARWLQQRLNELHVSCNGDPSAETEQSDICSFEVSCSESKSCDRLEKALASISEIKLMTRPE